RRRSTPARPCPHTPRSASRARAGSSGEGSCPLSTPPAARASSSSLAPEPREHVQQLVDLLLALRLPARANGVDDARLDVPAQQKLLDLVERALRSKREGCSSVDAARRRRAGASVFARLRFAPLAFAGCDRDSFHPF